MLFRSGFADPCLTTWLPRRLGLLLKNTARRDPKSIPQHRQKQVGWPPRVVINRLRGLAQIGRIGDRAAGIRIPVEAWKVAAGYFDADAMALPKHVAGHTGVDRQFVDFARPRQFRLLERFAVTQPQGSPATCF